MSLTKTFDLIIDAFHVFTDENIEFPDVIFVVFVVFVDDFFCERHKSFVLDP